MKFDPTNEQIEAAVSEGVPRTTEEANEIVHLVDESGVLRVYNAVMMGINSGIPPQRHWRECILLAMRIGWTLREQAGSTEGLVAPGEEAEIEAMLREIQGGATA